MCVAMTDSEPMADAAFTKRWSAIFRGGLIWCDGTMREGVAFLL
jgi:hypothetical protein